MSPCSTIDLCLKYRTEWEVSIRIIGSGNGEGDGEDSHEAVASVGGGVGEIEVADTSDVDSGNGGSGIRNSQEADFISALGAFRYRILYANVSYDHMVGWRTSSIRRESELVK
ncbi:hypothetical protein Tco_1442649, partial [Tanacetum coccineum]